MKTEPRESMEFDVVIVGAGPAGLAAAIRLKQADPELTVVVLEKGAEVGAHILSGAVVDPVGIDKLIPDWREDAHHPFKTEVKEDQFLFLGPAGSIRLPNFAMPPLMNNHGNYIVSLGNVCRWLAGRAEALGVEIYPGFAAAEVLYNDDGSVKGVATGDMGIERDGTPGPMYARGMELHGKYTLIGCSAGFVNVPRIKGSHNAVLSGILAADKVAEALKAGKANDDALDAYENEWRDSEIGKDLKRVRNVKPLWSRFGTALGVGIGGIDIWIAQITGGWSPLGTLKHGKPDYAATAKASEFKPIAYSKPDGVLTFDRLSSVFLSNTNHEEDQPVHLKVKDMDLQKSSEYAEFAGLSARYCPAGVYEWIDADGNSVPADADRKPGDAVRFQINAQNCVHCKTCDIKDPNQNINWTVPQGGEGPVYSVM